MLMLHSRDTFDVLLMFEKVLKNETSNVFLSFSDVNIKINVRFLSFYIFVKENFYLFAI